MRKFNVTVNGSVYEVEVEEVAAGAASAPAPQAAPTPKAAPAAPKAAPAPAAAPAAPAAAGSAGSIVVKAPMPGTILDVKVSVGQNVTKGTIVAVLEAMKMENEIFAPSDGVVASVNVSKGATVNADDVLVTMN